MAFTNTHFTPKVILRLIHSHRAHVCTYLQKTNGVILFFPAKKNTQIGACIFFLFFFQNLHSSIDFDVKILTNILLQKKKHLIRLHNYTWGYSRARKLRFGWNILIGFTNRFEAFRTSLLYKIHTNASKTFPSDLNALEYRYRGGISE